MSDWLAEKLRHMTPGQVEAFRAADAQLRRIIARVYDGAMTQGAARRAIGRIIRRSVASARTNGEA